MFCVKVFNKAIKKQVFFVPAFVNFLVLLLDNMESGVNDLVADCHRGLSCRHKSHAYILNNVSGGKGKISHFLGVDLLGLRGDRDISVVNGGVEQSKETEGKSGVDLNILVHGVNKVDLVVCADISVSGKLSRHVDSRVYKSLVALGRHALDDDHILVALYKSLVERDDVLVLDRLGEADLSALDSRGTDKGYRALYRLGEEQTLALGVYNETCGHLKSERG